MTAQARDGAARPGTDTTALARTQGPQLEAPGRAGGREVLILTASVGEGHDAPARVLARALEAAASTQILDVLTLLGPLLEAAAKRGMRLSLERRGLRWLFDLEYVLFARLSPTRRLGQYLLYRLGARRLLEAVCASGAAVVVATYPMASELLGALRARRRLPVPVCSVVTDLAGLRYWAHPGCDLHLVAYPEAVAEVERLAGAGSALAVRGLTAPAFLDPPSPGEARRILELPREGPVVAVSGGGWGVGAVAEAAETARSIPGVLVLCLCGRNATLAAELGKAFSAEERVRVLGFVEEMATLLSASDVLVHSTAGLTVLEASMVGCRVISFGLHVGHVRLNERAFAQTGIAEVVSSAAALRPAIERALAAPRRPRFAEVSKLPDAGAVVLELASAGSRSASRF